MMKVQRLLSKNLSELQKTYRFYFQVLLWCFLTLGCCLSVLFQNIHGVDMEHKLKLWLQREQDLLLERSLVLSKIEKLKLSDVWLNKVRHRLGLEWTNRSDFVILNVESSDVEGVCKEGSDE